MSAFGDYVLEHADGGNCGYCQEIEEMTDISPEEKWKLQAECAVDSVYCS